MAEHYTKEQIAAAVNDEAWQQFRKSLKGQPTERKLDRLVDYWVVHRHDRSDCAVCIRVDNYLKALCRGGQLKPGANLEWFINAWRHERNDYILK